MNELIIEEIDTALCANNGGGTEYRKDRCRCDASVGVTCEYCTIDGTLRHARRYFADTALQAVLSERYRQDAKWGEQNHDPMTYLAILSEEVGEFAQAALHDKFRDPREVIDDPSNATLRHNLRNEAVQVAAVALAIVECLDRDKWKWPKA